MSNNIYSKEAVSLFKEADEICSKILDLNGNCYACKYYGDLSCRVSCLQEKYDIINKKTLQLLVLDDYEDTHNICITSPYSTYTESLEMKCYPEMKCAKCFLELLLADKDIVFIIKENI